MNVVVFGANGPTGRLLTRQALDAGHRVTAVTRHPETFPLQDAHMQILRGDVYDLASVEEAVAGQDAVLSTLGVPYSRKAIRVYSEGVTHIMQAMKRYGLRRLVCVSSSATEPYEHSQTGFIFEKVLQPFFIGVVGRTLYDDMRRMETLVRQSDLEWTIVRPSGLFETATVTDYQMAEGHIDGIYTSRADLAACMLYQLSHDDYLCKAVAVATFAVQPNLVELLWREGLSKKG